MKKTLLFTIFIFITFQCFAHGEQVIPYIISYFLLILLLNYLIFYQITKHVFKTIKRNRKIKYFFIVLIVFLISEFSLILINNIVVNTIIIGIFTFSLPIIINIIYAIKLREKLSE